VAEFVDMGLSRSILRKRRPETDVAGCDVHCPPLPPPSAGSRQYRRRTVAATATRTATNPSSRGVAAADACGGLLRRLGLTEVIVTSDGRCTAGDLVIEEST